MESELSKMSPEEFNKFRSQRYARALVTNAFLPENVDIENDERAKYIYDQLKTGLEGLFNVRVSDVCPVCGRSANG